MPDRIPQMSPQCRGPQESSALCQLQELLAGARCHEAILSLQAGALEVQCGLNNSDVMRNLEKRWSTPPETNRTSPLKIGRNPNRKVVFQPSIFRCENVSFREGRHLYFVCYTAMFCITFFSSSMFLILFFDFDFRNVEVPGDFYTFDASLFLEPCSENH